MFTKKSKIRLYMPTLLHKADEISLIKDFSLKHDIPFHNIKVMSNNAPNISKDLEGKIRQQETGGDAAGLYAGYLNGKEYDEELFQKIDGEVSLETNYSFVERSSYKLKYISAYNLTSYGNITLNFESYHGTIGIFSSPPNFGGKSNLYKLIQILLWGKYLSLDEYSVLPKLFNDYIQDDYAFIEGSLELNNQHYFIRREFRREGKKRVKQDVYVYEMCEEQAAEKYVYVFDNVIREIEKKAHNPSLPDGMWVKIVDKNHMSVFYDAIGKIEDFIKICLFNQNTLYNLILTKKTERTRNFYALFGGEYYEKKKEIAKEKYLKFKKESPLYSVDLASLQNEVLEKQSQLKSSKEQLNYIVVEIEILTKAIALLEGEKNEKYSSLLPVSKDYDIDKKTKEKLVIENDIREAKIFILSLGNQIEANNHLDGVDIKNIKDEHAALMEKLSCITEDAGLKDAILVLERKKSNLSEALSNLNKRLAEITNKKLEIRREFDNNNNKVSFYEKEMSAIPDDVVCNNCGTFVTSHIDRRNSIAVDIQSLKAKNTLLKENADKLIEEEKGFLYEKDKADNEISTIEGEIGTLRLQMEKKLQLEKTELNNKIHENLDYQNKLEQFNKNKEILALHVKSMSEKTEALDKLANDIESFELANKNAISYNHNIKSEISILEEKIRDKNSMLSFHLEKRGGIAANIITLEKTIAGINSKISSFEADIKLDKAYLFYIESHDMNGVVKYMMESYLPIINVELNSLTEHLGFKIEIFLDADKYINYNFIRDGKMRDLKNISGCEVYIALMALYLAHIKFSKISLPNIVLFDEVFNQVDDTNIENVYEILKLYADVFDHVFIISHGRQLESLVDHNIFVEKENNISRLLN